MNLGGATPADPEPQPTGTPPERARVPGARRSLLVIGLLFGVFLAGTLRYVDWMSQMAMNASAVEAARRHSDTIAAFRTTYTAQVVQKARAHGLAVSHDVHDGDSIPLPVTMSILLGSEIARLHEGLNVQIYSPFPFPVRENSGGLRDGFQQEAWASLKAGGVESFHRFEGAGTDRILRFATPDEMRPECVNCHNTHPDTPRRDWKTGDIRGVVEVSFPVERGGATQQAVQRGSVAILLIGVLGFLIIAVIMRRLVAQGRIVRAADAQLATTQVELQRTRRRVTEEKLQVIEQLAAAIAHDFNNVLMVVTGHCDLALRSADEETEIARTLKKIRRGLRRARGLANKLPTTEDSLGFSVSEIDLNESVRDVAELIEPLLGRGIDMSLQLSADPVVVSADGFDIERVLMNLAVNATDAMREGDQLLISVSIDGNHEPACALLTVSDTGEGIPEEVLDDLFTPFFTTKPMGKGSGLGLFTVARVVEQQRGTVEVQSTVGEGTTISVRLPLVEDGAAQRPAAEDPVEPPLRILVAEDDPDVRQMLIHPLRQAGHHVVEARDGHHALALVTDAQGGRTHWDLLLSDLRMPRVAGRELAERMRRQQPGLPILFLSGFPEDSANLLEEFGPDAQFLVKPVSVAQIVEQVEALIVRTDNKGAVSADRS